MKPLPRFVGSLWTALVLTAIFKNCSAQCESCNDNVIEEPTITTTTVTFGSTPNCKLESGNNTGVGNLSDLVPGRTYQIFISCSNCCTEVTTKPEAVRNLQVGSTTTSSIYLTWEQPVGDSHSYNVSWSTLEKTTEKTVNETSVNITGLSANTKYDINVTTVAADNIKGKICSVSQYTNPEAVQNLTVTEITTSSVSLNWLQPEGQSSFYRVQWSNGTSKVNLIVTDTQRKVTDLTAGVKYTFTVIAVAGDNVTESEGTEISQHTQPEVVRNLTVTETTTSSMFLNWTEPVGQSSSYRLQWIGGDVNDSANATGNCMNITNLTAGVQYTISVSAVAGDGCTEGQITTLSHYTNPEAVQNLTVTEITTSSVCLNWTEPDEQRSFYRVQWSNGTSKVNVSVTDTQSKVTALTAGAKYTFTVIAVAGDNVTESQGAEISQHTKPEVVRNLTVTETSTSFVFLNWTEPVGQSSSYRVQWIGGDVNDSANVTGTCMNITNLTAGVQYTISVSAVAGDGCTEGQITTLSHYTKPEVVRNLTVTETSTSFVFLNWTEPVGQSSSYRLQWIGGDVNDSANVTGTYMNITNLTAGVQYTISVSAVADDGRTEGQITTVYNYTKPDIVRNLTVTETTTSSVFLKWTEPVGQSSSYRVQWTDGHVNYKANVTGTNIIITNLTAGVQYTISVSAVAGDGHTEGQSTNVSHYTKPDRITNYSISTHTTSISLNWTAPAGVLHYRVEWLKGGASLFTYGDATSAVLSPLIPGTKYTITIVSIAEDNATESDPTTFSSVTKPDVVKNLNITNITTSTVSLSWTKPMGNAIYYKIEWTPGEGTLNTSATYHTLTNLWPGYEYNITVAAVAEDETVGKGTLIRTFTSPMKPVNINATTGTRDVNITWTPGLPGGRVDHYVVAIYYQNQTSLDRSQVKDTVAHFSRLYPGRSYVVIVTAVAGNIINESDRVLFSTVPTPPGPINISERKTTSLRLQWATPEKMDGAPNISYLITYQPSDGRSPSNSIVASINEVLLALSSGTSYNITVQTAGPQSLLSTGVDISAFTLPHPVSNLVVSAVDNTTIRLEWSYPDEAKPYYSYVVQASNAATGEFPPQHVSVNSTCISGLAPGTEYNVTVTTMAAPESNSTEERASGYTRPKAVTDLKAIEANATAIQVTWSQQSDHKESYYYLVYLRQDGNLVANVTTKTEKYTFINLCPGHLYHFDVVTVIEGVESTVKSTTGQTNPDQASNIVAIGTTSNMTVSWTPAQGRVDSYSVYLYRGMNQLERNNSNLSNTTDNVNFPGLKPGVTYCVVVVTISGLVERNSSVICNTTFPNPPGPITVVSQTINSITFTWELPDDMDHKQYNFSVLSHETQVIVQNNRFSLDNLVSGTQYSISVVTVGLFYYKSTPVTAKNYTKPYPVTELRPEEVTNDTVILVWHQPEIKPNYTYMVHTVQINNKSNYQHEVVPNTTHKVTDLLSGSQYNFTVWAETEDGTQADPVTTFVFTRPNGINGLQANPFNSTDMNLSWMKPSEYKDGYTYRVMTTGCASRNDTETRDYTVIPELNPGTNCIFCVFVRVADGTEGKEECTAQYTKPEPVHPRMNSQGSNSSMVISWEKPNGNVEYYEIYLDDSQRLNTTEECVLFGSLSSGILYKAMVTTHSGPFSASSQYVSNATFPNPPGSIEILMKTTNSISFQWGEAPLMRSGSFVYQLTHKSFHGTKSKNVTGTNHTFETLISGTPYTISVATVGVQNFQSHQVRNEIVTTRPLHVKNLSVSAEEENVTVEWTQPDEYQTSYSYNISWKSAGGLLHHENIVEAKKTIEGLTPGTRYNLSVNTVTEDGTESAPENTLVCTNASPVKNLSCEGPNDEIAQILLMWYKPSGRYSRVELLLNNTEIINVTSACNQTCSHMVSNLSHYTEYKLRMETHSCGRPSIPVNLNCSTGITKPPIPANFESLVKATEIKHNMFTLQIDSSLLDSTNGPVTHFGVLVTDSHSGDDPTELSNYLSKTYQQWSGGQSAVYLATVIKTSGQTRSGNNPLVLQIGDGNKWGGYTNGNLRSNSEYWYAIVIFTNMSLNDDLVDPKKSLVSITNFYPTILLPQNPEVIAISVGATLGVFFILFVILIGFIIYWKRISKKESSDIQIHSLRAKVSAAVRVEDYEAYYKKQKADTNCGFAEEFEDLKLVGTGQSKTHALTQENKPKNRYNNVLPYDSSRVRLSIIHGSPYDDYINANYMPGFNSRKEFIAAQGPLPGTVNEFWRMIWEKNVQTVVMLTRCNEQGRVKCEQYWNADTKHFENITVKTVSEIPLEDWTIRDFEIKNVKTAETRPVRQFHFTAWPDHGVPETTELLISFRHLVREHMDQYSRHSPTVVHCSAGVGRTGTFIAIDRLIFQIERENYVDVYGTVHDLRMHRTLMVQTEDQYVFLNQCAVDIIRSRTGTNVDLIYQNTAALSIYENVQPKKGFHKNGYHNA